MNRIQKHIVIIGAGAAGIAAATKLYENGFTDMIILEAEDRIGGRIHSMKIRDNEVLEMGAAYIHARKKNCVYDLAASHNKCISSEITFENMIYARSSGELVKKDMTDMMRNAFRGIHHDDMKKSHDMKHFLKEFDEEFKKKQYDHIPKDIKKEFIENSRQFVDSHHYISDSWHDDPSNFSRHPTCGESAFILWKNPGYILLLDILMENCPEDFLDKYCLLSSKVVHVAKYYNRVKVQCSNKNEYIADHVICTVSIGVLQEFQEEMFEKNLLKEEKIRAFRGLTLGVLDKMYLRFDEPWWPTYDVSGFAMLWTKEDRQEFRKKGLEWATGIFGITRVDNNANMLCGWITGHFAKIMERINEEEVQKTFMLVLRKFLGKTYEITDSQSLYRTTWYINENFKGAYGFRNLVPDDEEVWSNEIANPVTNKENIPILLFAGEATHDHSYSTVHGAVESGWREAERLISLKK